MPSRSRRKPRKPEHQLRLPPLPVVIQVRHLLHLEEMSLSTCLRLLPKLVKTEVDQVALVQVVVLGVRSMLTVSSFCVTILNSSNCGR